LIGLLGVVGCQTVPFLKWEPFFLGHMANKSGHPRRLLSGVFVRLRREGVRVRSYFLWGKNSRPSHRMVKKPLIKDGDLFEKGHRLILSLTGGVFYGYLFAERARHAASGFHVGPLSCASHLALLTVPPARSGPSARWARAGRCHRPLWKTSPPKAPVGGLCPLRREGVRVRSYFLWGKK